AEAPSAPEPAGEPAAEAAAGASAPAADGEAEAPAEAPAAEQAEPPADTQAEASADQPAAEQPAKREQRPRRSSPPPPVSATRLAAAIDRAGGAEVVREALRPKTDEQGERKKWAVVCCEAAQGRKPGDPVFTAWVRLAATPVREIKAALGDPVDERRGRRGKG